MKRITIFILLFLSSSAFAGEAAIEKYIDSLIQMKQTEVGQLHDAIELLRGSSLTEQEKFEYIGQPSFSAVERALAEQGYTIMSLYRFEENNSAAINQWLDDHPAQAGKIDALEAEKESLSGEYDLLIKQTTADTEY